MDEGMEQFKEKGYVILKGLLNKQEVDRLRLSMETDPMYTDNEHSRDDSLGKRIRVCLWTTLPESITGTVAKCDKVISTVEKYLNGEVYHFHSKLIMKDPQTGGAFLWHQDYSYWYDYTCLLPTMGTLWIAVDKADRTNGCLQILEGSHKAGRIETRRQGDQIVADPARVEMLKSRFPLKYAELDPGDAMFFHSNLLHMSEQNTSGNRRWSLVIAYNRSDNLPYGDHPHGKYEKIVKKPNSAIMTCPLTSEGESITFYSDENVRSGLTGKVEV